MFTSSTPEDPARIPKEPRVRRPPRAREPVLRASLRDPTSRSAEGAGSARNGMEIFVAIRNQVLDASLENVCLVIGGVPYMPSGANVVRPGDTTAMIELPPEIAGVKASVYFELGLGDQRVPLISDQLFDFTPGAVCVLTINDHTRAHNAPIEVEGAVVRITRGRSVKAAR